mgnify:CR=1
MIQVYTDLLHYHHEILKYKIRTCFYEGKTSMEYYTVLLHMSTHPVLAYAGSCDCDP